MTHLKVGFLSSHNYLDRHAFSGTLFSMYRALDRQDLTLVNLGWPSKRIFLQKILRRLGLQKNDPLKVRHENFESEAKRFTALVQKQIQRQGCDVIFAPIASAEMAFLETQVPIVYSSDATLKQRSIEYKLNLPQHQFDAYDKLEFEAIARAKRIVYSSDWSVRSAIADYGADPGKLVVVDYGANLEDIPPADAIYARCQNPTCKLLFIGKDWQRKGGEIAFQILLALLEKGVDAELCMIGCVVPSHIQHPKLTTIAFLNKDIPQERQQLCNLFLGANFFVFPTQADCSPIVTCEANAFGLPIISTDVGGLPSIMRNGQNGFMLSRTAPPSDYADAIAQSFSDKDRYRQLVESARAEYDTRLNWDTWGQKVHGTLAEAAGR
ncbi:MAG: glycosyltransferase family 4 protein [Synechococcales bacterium]|nr:glycosyltransferase family 4 protein [Synechococcales bacterium]